MQQETQTHNNQTTTQKEYPILVSIEGNIGAGKSTIINQIKQQQRE